MVKKEFNLVRIYPGIRKDQKDYIKKLAKVSNKSEGEIIRAIIDSYKYEHET